MGTSAGGARAKAIIAWNPDTEEVRSGQVDAKSGFSDWVLKFDGVGRNRDKEMADPEGYGAIEYAYHRMAVDADIEMAECRLLEENGRRHFMTKRFDRTADGDKVHMQSLGGLAHFDYNEAGLYSYEQALGIIRRLELGIDAILVRAWCACLMDAWFILTRKQVNSRRCPLLRDKVATWE